MKWEREDLEKRLENKKVLGFYIEVHGKLIQLPPDGKEIHDRIGQDIAHFSILINSPNRGPWLILKRETWKELRERDQKSYGERFEYVFEVVNRYPITI